MRRMMGEGEAGCENKGGRSPHRQPKPEWETVCELPGARTVHRSGGNRASSSPPRPRTHHRLAGRTDAKAALDALRHLLDEALEAHVGAVAALEEARKLRLNATFETPEHLRTFFLAHIEHVTFVEAAVAGRFPPDRRVGGTVAASKGWRCG